MIFQSPGEGLGDGSVIEVFAVQAAREDGVGIDPQNPHKHRVDVAGIPLVIPSGGWQRQGILKAKWLV